MVAPLLEIVTTRPAYLRGGREGGREGWMDGGERDTGGREGEIEVRGSEKE